MTGNANSISALHVRYDQYNHGYLGFEQHLARKRPARVCRVLGQSVYERRQVLEPRHGRTPRLEVRNRHVHAALHLPEVAPGAERFGADDLRDPDAGASTARHLQAFFNQTNYNLLGPSRRLAQSSKLGAAHLDILQQPNLQVAALFSDAASATASITTPTASRITTAISYTTICNEVVGFTVSLPNVKIGDREKPYALYYLNASLNSSRTWNSVPHHINAQNTTVSLSRQFSKFVNSYLSYNVQNTSDLYLQGGYAAVGPASPRRHARTRRSNRFAAQRRCAPRRWAQRIRRRRTW